MKFALLYLTSFIIIIANAVQADFGQDLSRAAGDPSPAQIFDAAM